MNLGKYLTEVEEGLQVITTIEIDEQQLQGGGAVSFPTNLQVGTKDAKPVRLKSITLQEG